MKYVYIIMENRHQLHEYDYDTVYGVYTTQELAEKYIPDDHSSDCDYSYYILTQEVTEE